MPKIPSLAHLPKMGIGRRKVHAGAEQSSLSKEEERQEEQKPSPAPRPVLSQAPVHPSTLVQREPAPPEAPMLPEEPKIGEVPAPSGADVGSTISIVSGASDVTRKSFSNFPNQTELSSPEVTSALGQLLGEWKLFRGKGLFRTGASGIEHPLYKQLAQLSMFAVLAGRWERSTPEITQGIKDYIDGWRFEQGIMHTPSETFEHYLRRVVLRILRRQREG
jgi:hypothetical protein